MGFSSLITRSVLGAVLIAALAAGDSLAERGERGRGGGGDRGGGGGGGGGGGDGGSGRSISRGDGGGGGGVGRSFSGGGGGRSSSRGDGGSAMRSFSGGEGSSRSFSRGDGGGSRSIRSFSGDGGGRSFSGGDSGRSLRSFSGEGSGRSFSRGDGGSSRTFSRQSAEGIQRSLGSDPSRSDRSFSGGSIDGSSRSFRSLQRSDASQYRGRQSLGDADSSSRGTSRSNELSGGTDSSRNFSGRYRAARPTEDQVQRFLGDTSRGNRSNEAQPGGDRGDRSNLSRIEGDRNVGDQNRRELSRRFDRDSDRQGDELSRRLGRDNDGDRGDLSRRLGDREGDSDRGESGRNRDRDFDRDDDDRDGDRDFVGRGGDRDWDRGDRDSDRGDRDWDRDRDGRRGGDRDRWDWTRRHVRDHYRDRWRDRDWDDWNKFPFYVGWWGGHRHNHWGPWFHHHGHFNNPWYWWSYATVPRITGWFDYGWQRPYYWDYGPGEYIYVYNDVVYVNGEWYAPAPVYYDRTVEVVESVPELTVEEAQQIEWLPLGVFAVAKEGSEEFDLMVQLAVSKDGIIGGTVFDEANGKSYPAEGKVDQQTQRAVWAYTGPDGKRIVMETGVYNLTKEAATALVHYGPEQIEVRQLVRLEEPEGGGTATTTARPAVSPDAPLPVPQ